MVGEPLALQKPGFTARCLLFLFLIAWIPFSPATSGPRRVKPDLQAISYPTIKIINFVPDALGAVAPDEILSDVDKPVSAREVHVTAGTQLQLIIRADDPIGGIAKLDIEPFYDTRRFFHIVQTEALDAEGYGAAFVALIGHAPVRRTKATRNVTVGPGMTPIIFRPNGVTRFRVTATNFQGRSSTFYASFIPLQRVRARIEAPPEINLGQTVILYQDWAGATDVSITPSVPLVPGGAPISPTADTTYEMVARQPFPDAVVGYPNANGIGQTMAPTVARSKATIKVRRPAAPTGPVTTPIYLESRPPFEGWHPYALRWPPTGSTGAKLVSVANPNGFVVRLVTTGHNSDDCDDIDAVVSLNTGSATTAEDNKTLFYAETPALPVDIVACILNGATDPPNVRLDVTYINP